MHRDSITSGCLTALVTNVTAYHPIRERFSNRKGIGSWHWTVRGRRRPFDTTPAPTYLKELQTGVEPAVPHWVIDYRIQHQYRVSERVVVYK